MIARSLLAAGLVACLLSAPVLARASGERSAPIADSQLDQLRGGFLTAGGVALGFGATTRTYIDGRMVLETQLTWADDGVKTASSGGALDAATLSSLAAAGIKPGDLTGATAYVTADGASTVVQRVTGGQLTNMVLNTADGRSISQNTEVSLTLPGFAQTQAQLSNAMTAARLSQAVADASIMAARR